MHFYKRWNNITGWAVFAVAAMVYLMTMEPVSSLWDCSEFIATSYKLEVGHPPGAPLFMMLARLATLFAFGNPDYVGIAVNAMNSLASAFCILFLFWTITHLARRLVTRDGAQLTAANTWAVLGAGAVGALAYTFTDTFWFSAVEGEVYALSSMFTALVVWLMLKWEEQADEPHSSRWIVLIAYLMGLSIGVHILNLLCIPALVFIYYFRKTATVTWRGIALSTLVSGAMIVFVNNIIIPYTVWIGAQIDTLFVNTFGLPVNSGITLFALALIIGLGWAAWAAHRRGRVLLNIILLSTTMILVGYSSYASVTIRAAANPPMNSNNPNNPHALLSLLNRDQYGDRPLLYGAQYSAPPEGVKEKKVWYLDEDGKYKTATVLTGYTHAPEFMQLFPRMWNYSKGEKAYKEWAAYRTKTETLRDDKGEVLRDAQGRPMRGETLDFGRKRAYTDSYGETRTVTEPTFWENVHFFFNYQLSYMYWRYFMWNFVGRQSDIQPSRTTITDGNWLSGIRWIDEKYVGPQDNLPREIAENKGRNTYYFLPFLLGLIGLRLPVEPRPAQLLDRAVAVRDDGHRAGLLLQHLARRAARTRLRLCGIVLRLLDLDRIRRAGPARPDRPALEARQRGDGSRGNGRRNERPGHPRGPELGRPRPFAPHDGPRHRLELPPVDAPQLDHPQLRRQRHLPAVEQSGGLRRAPRRADYEHLLPRRRVVHRRDEDQGQRRPRRPLLAAQAASTPSYNDMDATSTNSIDRRGGDQGGDRLRAQRRPPQQGQDSPTARWPTTSPPSASPCR